MKRNLSKLPRQQLWMLMSFALYTKNDELIESIQDEVQQRKFLIRGN